MLCPSAIYALFAQFALQGCLGFLAIGRLEAGQLADIESALAIDRPGMAEGPEAVQTVAMAYRDGELGLARDEMQARHFMLETAHALKHPALRP